MNKKIGIVFLLAFLVRLISLNQSLWLDEAVTAKVVKVLSFGQIPLVFSPGDFHPPTYYLFMKLWTNIFGYSEIALRMPSVLFSLLTGYFVYKIGSDLKSKTVGLWAAALYVFNPLVVYYSQEARMYSLVVLLLTAGLYYGLRIIGKQKKQNQIRVGNYAIAFSGFKFTLKKSSFINSENLNVLFLGLFLSLSIAVFYGSIFFVAAILLLLLIKRQYKPFIFVSLLLAGTGFLLSPLLFQQLAHAKSSLFEVVNWKQVLGTASLKNLLLIGIKFTIGRISFYPKWAYYLLAAVLTVFTFCFVILGSLKNKRLAFLFIIPLILGMISSFITPMLQYFRFLYLIPVMCLLIVIGIESYVMVKKKKGFFSIFKRQKKHEKLLEQLKEYLVFEVVFGIFLSMSLVYVLLPQFHREDWKSASNAVPKESTVYMILPSSDPVVYYRPDLKIKEIRSLGKEGLYDVEIYVFPYVTEVYGFDYKTELYKKGCIMKEKKTFRELIFEKWNCGLFS